VPVTFASAGGAATDVANDTVDAINAVSNLTGVTAVRGDTTNGGVADSVVLYNSLAGDESDIVISGYTSVGGSATGLANGTFSVGANANTGRISLAGDEAFVVSSNNFTDDTILARIGLDGGSKGFADESGDGEVIYGNRLATDDLEINGIDIVPTADNISSVYEDISAAAKAAAINSVTDQTGVYAEVVPASVTASGAVEAGTETSKLVATLANNINIAAGDLAINGVPTTAAINTIVPAPTDYGFNMARAATAKDVVNVISDQTGVTATLTTLYAGAACDNTLGVSNVSFDLNGVTINVNANGTNPVHVSQQVVAAINAVSDQTGVTATRGDSNNGGPTNSIVLYNSLEGDETPIIVANLDANETLRTGLSNTAATGQVADTTHNTGKISFSSNNSFTLSSPNNLTDDDILKEFDLDGGESETGISGDIVNDGELEYGSTPYYLSTGDLQINGVDIFTNPTAITSKDSTNALISAINDKSGQTGVIAGRDSVGRLILTAEDGRNIQIETSAKGEKVTHLNGGLPQPQNQVYFGSVRLTAGKEFYLDSNTTTVGGVTVETGFAAMGLDGGSAVTNISGDTAADGRIFVNEIFFENGYIRYAGDRNNDIAIKVGSQSSMDINKNGYDAVMDTGIFTALKNLEDYFRGQNYKGVTGFAQALDTSALLNSGDTGLELADELTSGSFTITVNSHDASPVSQFAQVEIGIDPSIDTLDSVVQRINGVPGISATWVNGGYLQITSDDPDRYSFKLSDDTSNFLRVTATEPENVQVSSISDSIAELDTLMERLTAQISDFGARANRITVQTQIYTNIELATRENLSEKEDTDLVEALMEIKAKELAYEAALSSAAKTMQLSLVNFL
jgi:hypothetical protein